MQKYATIDKLIGETPLEATERLRQSLKLSRTVPLAYAGRLDPMATGKLLVVIGSECKVQEKYHSLDKAYTFEVLFGISSDTSDVLGLTTTCDAPQIDADMLKKVLHDITGKITLPYPHFSSKTVKGKPLHTWTLEGRLGEIEIPTKEVCIYALKLENIRTVTIAEVSSTVSEKIESIPLVVDERKALGNDFRRDDVRKGWSEIVERERTTPQTYQIATITCICSSGTYMRTLAKIIGERLGTCALAYSIQRTTIGKYIPLAKQFGFWWKKYN